jgi:hypothetical protein
MLLHHILNIAHLVFLYLHQPSPFVCCMIDLLLPPVYIGLSQLVFTGNLLLTISSRKLASHNACLIW